VHFLVVLSTTAASLLGHRRHGRVRNSRHRRARRSFRRARLPWLNAEESVEESEAEFSAASEIHEKIDRVVDAGENGHDSLEERSYSALFRSLFQK